jgi:basic amino acid/polyamine antiporter, APA family
MSAAGGMRLPTMTALVTGTIIGSGIFTLPAALAAYGPISMWGFAITAGGALALALVFAMLTQRNPQSGGPYAYAKEGFGDFIGFQTAWNYWIGAWAGVGAISVSMVGYLGQVVPGLDSNRPAQMLVAVGTIAFFVWVNDRGVQAGGIASLVLTILKVVPLIAVGTLGFLAFNAANLSPANVSGDSNLTAIVAATTLTLFAFIGIEAASIPAQAVHEPKKTIPRATMIGTLLAAAVYLASTMAVFGALSNEELRSSDAPFSTAASQMFGDWAGPTFAVVAVISCLGALNGLLLLAGQVPLAAAVDRLAPSSFGRLNARNAPWLGLLISGGLAAGLTVLNFSGSAGVVEAYQKLLLISTLTTLFPYLFTAGAQLKWLLADRHSVPVSHFARNLVITLLALAYSIFAVMGAGFDVVYWGFVLVMIGVPLYVLILRWRRPPDDVDAPSPPLVKDAA